MRITAVIPTYNEAANLPILVERLSLCRSRSISSSSTTTAPDGTVGALPTVSRSRISKRLAVLHRRGRRGLRSATAYLEGFRVALDNNADAIAQMDADLSHDPARLPDMARALETSDLVLGSRYVPGGSVDERWPIWRKGLSAWGNFYARSILGLKLRDITTGFRLWRREALLAIPLEDIRSNGYIFLVEMAFIAERLGFRLSEVPIHFNDRRFGLSEDVVTHSARGRRARMAGALGAPLTDELS